MLATVDKMTRSTIPILLYLFGISPRRASHSLLSCCSSHKLDCERKCPARPAVQTYGLCPQQLHMEDKRKYAIWGGIANAQWPRHMAAVCRDRSIHGGIAYAYGGIAYAQLTGMPTSALPLARM
jgi:hypothetical protein